jgi:methanogenic corrinoid protein MtbC1
MTWFKALLEKEPAEPSSPIGTVVIGTLHPDLIDTAKEMVRKSLKRVQFKTVDVGVDASVSAFLLKIKESNPDIVVVTLSISAAKENLMKMVSALEAEGLKSKIKIMIGGAAVTKEDAESIGALYGKTRQEAVELAKKAIEQIRNKN